MKDRNTTFRPQLSGVVRYYINFFEKINKIKNATYTLNVLINT